MIRRTKGGEKMSEREKSKNNNNTDNNFYFQFTSVTHYNGLSMNRMYNKFTKSHVGIFT